MKKILLAAIIVLAYSTLAISGTANWTGKQMTITGSTGFTAKCEYTDGAVKFWRLTNGACQPTVEATSGAVPKTNTKRNKDQHTPMLKTYP